MLELPVADGWRIPPLAGLCCYGLFRYAERGIIGPDKFRGLRELLTGLFRSYCRMIYRGFRIADESRRPAKVEFVIYETFRGHWRRVAIATAHCQAEAMVDALLAKRERLFGTASARGNS
jgi:hypothetical protein